MKTIIACIVACTLILVVIIFVVGIMISDDVKKCNDLITKGQSRILSEIEDIKTETIHISNLDHNKLIDSTIAGLSYLDSEMYEGGYSEEIKFLKSLKFKKNERN